MPSQFDLLSNVYYRNVMAILAFIYLLQNISFWLTLTFVVGVLYSLKAGIIPEPNQFKKILTDVVKKGLESTHVE